MRTRSLRAEHRCYLIPIRGYIEYTRRLLVYPIHRVRIPDGYGYPMGTGTRRVRLPDGYFLLGRSLLPQPAAGYPLTPKIAVFAPVASVQNVHILNVLALKKDQRQK